MHRVAGRLMVGAGIVAALTYISDVNYLLFHGIVEGVPIVISFTIFFLVWNSRSFLQNNYLLFLGTAFPFIGFLDFLHLLSYQGMGVFEGSGANLPTQFWIQARYLQAFTFLLAPFFFRRRVRESLVFTAFAMVTALFLLSVFALGIFPDCYLEPGGLTPFKKVSEYVISLLLVASLVLVVRRQEFISRVMFRYLTASILTTIGSELAFTFYVSVYGLSNMIGHLLKILAFFFIYKGVIEKCLRSPYHSLFLDLKNSEEALRAAEKELLTRNEELEAFLHTAGHDLRSPLSSINGFATLMETHLGKGDLEKAGMAAGHVRVGVKRLDRLLKDLLDFAYVGRKAAVAVPVDIPELVSRISEEKREELKRTGAGIVVADGLPVIHLPETEAYQVFSNLVSNSLKFYRPDVAPRIEIRPGPSTEKGFRTIVFEDNGIGIAREDLDRIFDLFVALDNSRQDGTGAGLAIVKRIVEHNGGSITVDSTPGVGTIFTMILPTENQQ